MRTIEKLSRGTAGAVLFALVAPAPVLAEPGWILDMRARYETVDQDGFAENAEALTLRTRLGYETGIHQGFSLLVEGEHVLHLVDDFNDTVNGETGFPVVADPDVTQLNRLQLRYSGLADTAVTAGRQRIVRGDARYIGNVGFRQNEQTFDGLFATHGGIENLALSYAYIAQVNRIFGEDHPAGELDTAIHAADAAYTFGDGILGGFVLLADFEDAAGLSSATYGVNWRGSNTLANGVVLGHFAEIALQTDYANAPADFDLTAFRGELTASANGLGGALGVEILDGDGSRGFSTPLATLHKFQGWADAFLATPADGIRDLYVRASYAVPEPAFGRTLDAALVYHDFRTADGERELGEEIDAVLTSRLTDRISLELKAAFFRGEAGAPADRDKLWLTLSFAP